jgi:hypothetical protein
MNRFRMLSGEAAAYLAVFSSMALQLGVAGTICHVASLVLLARERTL